MNDTLIFILLLILLGLVVFMLIKLLLLEKTPKISDDLERLERMLHTDTKDLRQELGQSLLQFNDSIRKTVEERLDKMRSENWNRCVKPLMKSFIQRWKKDWANRLPWFRNDWKKCIKGLGKCKTWPMMSGD